jgi:hypothetical protein
MGWRRTLWAGAAALGAVGLAACGSSASSPTTSTSTSTTAIAPAAALATGTYVPAGAAGTPHYLVTIDSANGTAFRGHMDFVYQDGRTAHVFDFSGTVSGQSAAATTANAATGSAAATVSSLPATLHIGVGSGILTFEGCEAYLPFAHSADACAFGVSG